jgi:hypothetical protein
VKADDICDGGRSQLAQFGSTGFPKGAAESMRNAMIDKFVISESQKIVVTLLDTENSELGIGRTIV